MVLLFSALLVPAPLRVTSPVLDAQLVGMVVKDAQMDRVAPLLEDPVEQADFEKMGLPEDTPDAELQEDPVGDLDSEVVTLGLNDAHGDTLEEMDDDPDTVPSREDGVGTPVWVREVVPVAEGHRDGVGLTVTHPVGEVLLHCDGRTENEKEALPVVLTDAVELPLDKRDTDPLPVAFAGVREPLADTLPRPLTDAEKEEGLEALALPLGREVAVLHWEAEEEREDDPLTLGLRVAVEDALLVAERDTEGETDSVGLVVGVMESVIKGDTLLRGLPLPLPVLHSVGEPRGLIDADTETVVVLVDDRLRVDEDVTEGLLDKDGLAEKDGSVVPLGVNDTLVEGDSVTVTVREKEVVALGDIAAVKDVDMLVVSLYVCVLRAVCDTLGLIDADTILVVEWDWVSEAQGEELADINEEAEREGELDWVLESIDVGDPDAQRVKEGVNERSLEGEAEKLCSTVYDPEDVTETDVK